MICWKHHHERMCVKKNEFDNYRYIFIVIQYLKPNHHYFYENHILFTCIISNDSPFSFLI